jgi:hypothetical protein
MDVHDLPDPRRRRRERFFIGNFLGPGPRVGDPLLGQISEVEAPMIANPMSVDRLVHARAQTDHLLPGGVDVQIAAPAAGKADRLVLAQVPSPHLVEEIPADERPHRAEIDDVAGKLVVQLHPREEPDLRLLPPPDDGKLPGAGDLVQEAGAAGAEDATLAPKGHLRPQDVIRLDVLGLLQAAVAHAVAEGVIL